MAPRHYTRTYHRFTLFYPVIFGGAPFVGEGIMTNLSLTGCSILSDREVLLGNDVRVSVLVPNQAQALSIDLGKIKWVRHYEFGVEFLRLPFEARERLNRLLRIELIEWLKIRSGKSESLESHNGGITRIDS